MRVDSKAPAAGSDLGLTCLPVACRGLAEVSRRGCVNREGGRLRTRPGLWASREPSGAGGGARWAEPQGGCLPPGQREQRSQGNLPEGPLDGD